MITIMIMIITDIISRIHSSFVHFIHCCFLWGHVFLSWDNIESFAVNSDDEYEPEIEEGEFEWKVQNADALLGSGKDKDFQKTPKFKLLGRDW